jgi:DNA-binding NarL/FixJ family response regulator
MQSCQIILANEPRLLRSMFRRVFGKVRALEVAGELGDLARLPSLVDETDAQWVIVSLSPNCELPDSVSSLVASHPAMGIVGVAADGSVVKIQRGGQAEAAAAALSLDQLVAALTQQPALFTNAR